VWVGHGGRDASMKGDLRANRDRGVVIELFLLGDAP
jgi:hypothetical protein